MIPQYLLLNYTSKLDIAALVLLSNSQFRIHDY